MIAGGQFKSVELAIPDFTSWTAETLTVGAGELLLPPGFDLNVTGDMTMLAGANLHFQASATNAATQFYGSRLSVGGNLELASGAWIHPHAEMTNGAVVGILVAGDVHIASDASIDADARGYASMDNNTSGPGAGGNNSSGGGYGGLGGGTAGGATYARDSLPVAPGSPGGWYVASSGMRGRRGGGAIHLLAGGNLHIDGSLSANAEAAVSSFSTTAGSGGGILVSCRNFSGEALLRASGGAFEGRTNASGGGGRIAVWWRVPLEKAKAMAVGAQPPGVNLMQGFDPADWTLEALAGGPDAQNGSTGFYGVTGTLIMVW